MEGHRWNEKPVDYFEVDVELVWNTVTKNLRNFFHN